MLADTHIFFTIHRHTQSNIGEVNDQFYINLILDHWLVTETVKIKYISLCFLLLLDVVCCPGGTCTHMCIVTNNWLSYYNSAFELFPAAFVACQRKLITQVKSVFNEAVNVIYAG